MARVCVYCASSDGIAAEYLTLAREMGVALAAAGHSLISGGGRVGMMGEVARGARAGGARTIGVIPEHLVPYELADTDADELIIVPTMRERKRLMEDGADAFVALPGGLGTLEELFEMWTSGSLGMHAKPVIVLDAGGFYAPLWAFLDDLCARGFVRAAAMESLHRVGSVDEALKLLPD